MRRSSEIEIFFSSLSLPLLYLSHSQGPAEVYAFSGFSTMILRLLACADDRDDTHDDEAVEALHLGTIWHWPLLWRDEDMCVR